MRAGGKAGDRVLQGDPTGIPFQKKALPPREAQIAKIVFQHREVTARTVCDALQGQVTNAAVRSMLQRLIRKGILRRRLKGHRYVYAPAQHRQPDPCEALRKILDEHFDGCFARAQAELARVRGQA